jgi:hypothetical protein
MAWDQKIVEYIAAVTRGVLGVKLGPGVLATIIPINTIGLVALAALVWALAANPTIALIALLAGLAFLVYANERAFRYAQANPIPALLGGGELVQLFRDQMSAKDKAIVSDQEPVEGVSGKLIEGNPKS